MTARDLLSEYPEQRPEFAPGFSTRLSIAIAFLLATVVMIIGMNEEPYHIDELRQTRSYTMDIEEVIDRSFAQDQPPLDPVLNSLAQRAIGQGDWQQRALSVLWAIAGYACFAALSIRHGLSRSIPVGILVMALSPLLISVFAYARPYALPFFLVMAFLLATSYWIEHGQVWAGFALTATALLLPLSRTIEPNLALLLAMIVLLVLKLWSPDGQRKGSLWLPLGAGTLGLVGVGLPVYTRLRSQLTAYTEEGLLPSAEQLMRLITDVPVGLARVTPAWPVVLALVVGAFVVRPVRVRLLSIWWFWIIALLPVCFTVLFVLTTDPAQPLFDRYFFTWIPPLALIVTVIVDETAKASRRSSILATAGFGLVAVFLTASGLHTARALSTAERGDWEALSGAIEVSTADDTVIVLETIDSFGAYRTPFAGKPRYLSPDRTALHTPEVIRNPEVIGTDAPVALVIGGPAADVKGWRRIIVDDYFSLYVPHGEVRGPEEAARTLEEFGRHYEPRTGSTLLLTAASLFSVSDHREQACRLLDELRNLPQVGSEIERFVESGEAPTLARSC